MLGKISLSSRRETHCNIIRRFWWPSLNHAVKEFVASCPVCAQNKSSNRPPAGVHQPLSIPRRPWLHIALNFVTGLPTPQGNTVILTIVDRFFKSVHLVPLPKLPSAKKMAEILMQQVFRIHMLPLEVVSDRGCNLYPTSGEPSASYWKSLLFCLQDFILRAMGRQNRPSSRWRRCFVVWHLRNCWHGVTNYPGSSMQLIPSLSVLPRLPTTPVYVPEVWGGSTISRGSHAQMCQDLAMSPQGPTAIKYHHEVAGRPSSPQSTKISTGQNHRNVKNLTWDWDFLATSGGENESPHSLLI